MWPTPSFLTDLFEARTADRERCNMVVLMLVVSVFFKFTFLVHASVSAELLHM